MSERFDAVAHLGARAAVEQALARAAEAEPRIHAFAHLDPASIRRDADAVDARGGSLPLRGVPVAVKDLIDTADQPTTYGSAIYADHRPETDAAVVTRLRRAGAVPFGKTVTTEFALFTPPVTRNPWNTEHTPGGSSSGSAAAVAAGVVPAALGTQSAGSMIRPASYCGVVGFKPTYGAIDTTGVKPLSPSFDTLGIFGRDVADVTAVFAAIADVPGSRPGTGERPRVAVCRTGRWDAVEATARESFDEAVGRVLGEGSIEVVEVDNAAEVGALAEAQAVVMQTEIARCLDPEFRLYGDRLSVLLHDVLTLARQRTTAEAESATATVLDGRRELDRVFGCADVLLTPAADGPAPRHTEGTGDPWFCRPWTALRAPAISLPVLRGAGGMPFGLQLVGRPGTDGLLLDMAERVQVVLGRAHPGR